ncbi:MAG: hypothetical protein ACRD3W_08980, partial [Terriglobales bacterium]
LCVLVAPICIGLAVLLFYAIRERRSGAFTYRSSDNLKRWMQQCALVTATSALGLLPCFHAIPLR